MCSTSENVQYELSISFEVHASRSSSLVQGDNTKNAFHFLNHKSYLYISSNKG